MYSIFAFQQLILSLKGESKIIPYLNDQWKGISTAKQTNSQLYHPELAEFLKQYVGNRNMFIFYQQVFLPLQGFWHLCICCGALLHARHCADTSQLS